MTWKQHVIIRSFQPADEPKILELNETSVDVLSPMDRKRFQSLREMAALLLVAEENSNVIAFLLAFYDGAEYDSINYRWFSSRLNKFLYIDRLVVSQDLRSVGIGQKFYSEAEEWARKHHLNWLAAEVDIKPPNSASLKFHSKQKFIEVARQSIDDGKKAVSLQVKSIR